MSKYFKYFLNSYKLNIVRKLSTHEHRKSSPKIKYEDWGGSAQYFNIYMSVKQYSISLNNEIPDYSTTELQ